MNIKRLEEESIAKAEELKEGARSYAVEMLKKVNSNIEKLNNIISNNIKELEEYDL